MIFLRHPFDPIGFKCLEFESTPVNGHIVRNAIVAYFGYDDFQLLYNGRKLQDDETLPEDSTVHATFRLPGGKGGFGSMLRAIGAQIEKTTNREACRDLSGRRLRDINEEQRLKKWIAKEAEREAEKIKRRQARIERLKSKPAHKFFDFEYEKEISSLPERVNDALSEGLQKVKKHPSKRPADSSGPSKPPKKKWLGDEFSSTSSDSDSDGKGMSNESPSNKQKNDLCDSDSCEPFPSSSKEDSHMESEDSTMSQQEACTLQLQLNLKCVDNIDTQSGSTSDFESSISQPGSSFKNGSRSESDENSMSQPEQYSYPENSKSINSADSKAKSDLFENNCRLKILEKDFNSSKAESLCKEDNKLLGENESKISSAVDKEPDSVIILEGNNDVSRDKTSETKEEKSETKGSNTNNESEIALPISLSDFQSISDLESLGLEKLKSELMIRGLKCGGTLSDRAERLWRIKDLQPHEYPASVLAKNKK